MGLFTKIKDIFYDPVDPEEETKEVKKEEKVKIRAKEEPKKIQEVEIESETREFEPTVEIKKVKDEVIDEVKSDNTYTERELFRNERTFNFTEFDDDVHEPQRPTALDIERRTSRITESIPVVEQKPKMFKPSPVISPIYGILDKDYNKEDIIERKEVKHEEEKKHKTDYDVVRRKAYGTLEDTLEDTMISTPKEVKESVNEIESEMDKLNSKTAKIEDLISRIEDTNPNITIGELEDRAKDEEFEEEQMKELEKTREFNNDVADKTITDDTLEHDLFNLIDSMYDDKEE